MFKASYQGLNRGVAIGQCPILEASLGFDAECLIVHARAMANTGRYPSIMSRCDESRGPSRERVASPLSRVYQDMDRFDALLTHLNALDAELSERD
ncbi:hypothetical protein V4C53_10475 [Paraburkholderia azotifigens]|uniref:hypothetical protein n=1 Tax=Paraburkholderia azotifigens TaxID=2057004 RepID=UPI0031825848